jgi:hypothetical protein
MNFILLPLSFVLFLFLPHPVLDVIVDDEIQLFIRKAIVTRQHVVYFVCDGLGLATIELGIADFCLHQARDDCQVAGSAKANSWCLKWQSVL